MANINLIPEQEVALQTKTKAVKFSTVLAIFLLIVVAGIGAYYFYNATSLRNQISEHENNVTSLRGEISALATIEISSRNLYTKSSTLSTIFNERVLYSKMLENLDNSTPPSILVDSFSLGNNNTINVSGDGETYNSIQDFSNNLLEKDLFISVELNTVTLDSNDGRINFFIVVNYDPVLLH